MTWTYRVTIDDEKLAISFKLFPFLPPLLHVTAWNDVIEVRASRDLFLPENGELAFTYRSPEGKTKHLAIILFNLRHRRDLVREIFSRLPPHSVVEPGLLNWTETEVVYPKWQIIFLIAGLILGMVMLLR